MPALAIVVFVVAVVALLVYGRHQAAARTKALSAAAARLGLRFHAGKDRTLASRFPDFKTLHTGHSRYASNVMAGRLDDREAWAFDYCYTTGSGKNQQTHRLSAVILEGPVPLQDLLIRRERLGDKVAGFFGFEDIDFESAEFSRKFFVKASNRKWAYDVIHPRMMEFLMQNGDFAFQFAGRHVIAWESGQSAPPTFSRAIETIRGIFERLPEYLIHQQGGRLAPPAAGKDGR